MKYFIGLFVRSGAVLFALLLTYVQTQTITIEELGYYNIGYVLLLGISTCARYGIGLRLIKVSGMLLAEKKMVEVHEAYMVGIVKITISSILLMLVALYAIKFDFICALLNNPPLEAVILFMLAIPINSLLFIYGSYLRVLGKPNQAPIFEVMAVTVILLIIVFISLLFGVGLTLLHYAAYYFTASVVVLLVAMWRFYLSSRVLGYKHASSFYSLLRKRIPLSEHKHDYAWIEIVSYFTFYSVYLVAAAFLNAREVGIFSILNRIANVFNLIMSAVNGITIADYAKFYSDNNCGALKRLCNRSLAFVMIVSAPVFLVIVYFHDYLLGVFALQAGVGEIVWSLIILTSGQFVSLLAGPANTMLSMTKYHSQLKIIVIYTLLLGVVISSIASYQLGLIGLATGVALTLIIRSCVLLIYTRLKMGFYTYPSISG